MTPPYNPSVSKRGRSRPGPTARPAAIKNAAAVHHSRWPFAAIAGGAFLIKLIVLLQLHGHPLLQPRSGLDNAVYLDLARQIAGGDWAGGAGVYFVSPLYMYFAGVAFAISANSVFFLQLLQIALGALAVWLIADTAGRWFGARGLWIAGVLATLTGYFTFNEILTLQSSLDTVLTALGFWLITRAWSALERGRRRGWLFAAAGAAIALHVLNRPNVGLWLATALAITLILRLGKRAAGAGHPAVAMLAGACVVLAPVAIRNRVVSGSWALVSAQGGLNFYIGNNAQATGTYHDVPGVTPNIEGQARDMAAVASAALGRTIDANGASSYFYRQAFDWIEAHPLDAAKLFGRKIVDLFNATDVALNDSYTFFSRDVTSLLSFLIVGPWLLIPLGIAGIWLGRPSEQLLAERPWRAATWWPWITFIPIYALSVAAFFIAGRYRLPLLVAFTITSAGAIDALWRAWQAAQWKTLASGGAAIVALAVGVNLNIGLDDGRLGWRAEMVQSLIADGKSDQAEALFAKTEPDFPNRALLHFRTGQAYVEHNDAPHALPHLERAIALAPGRADMALEYGHALLMAGRASDAMPQLTAALNAHVRPDVAAAELARAAEAANAKPQLLAALRGIPSPETLDPAAQAVIGRLAMQAGDPPLAIGFLSRAASALPQDAGVHAALGIALGMTGRRAESAAAFEIAAHLQPTNPSARLNLAVAYAQLGRMDDAKREADVARSLAPDDPRIAEFLRRLGGK